MGVIACSRHHCRNIMCDYHSYEHGNLCQRCFQELEDKGFCSIVTFMNSAPPEDDSSNEWKDHLDNIFLLRSEHVHDTGVCGSEED